MLRDCIGKIFGRAARCAALFFVVGAVALPPGPAEAKMGQERLILVTGGGERDIDIDIEVAEAPEDMAMGLMFRTSLADGKGMLFPSAAPREADAAQASCRDDRAEGADHDGGKARRVEKSGRHLLASRSRRVPHPARRSWASLLSHRCWMGAQ